MFLHCTSFFCVFFRVSWFFCVFLRFSSLFFVVLRFSSLFFVFLRFSTCFYVLSTFFLRFFYVFSTFFRFRSEIALLRPIRYCLRSEKIMKSLILRPIRFRDSATTANAVFQTEPKKTEMALLRPIQHGQSAGPFRKRIGRSIGDFIRFFKRN